MSVARKEPNASPLASAEPSYERDVFGWSMHQAALLRAGRWDEMDVANIVEEIESVGRSEYDRLTSFAGIILLPMLKWDHQPGRRSRSWVMSIKGYRVRLEKVLRDNPSLKPRRGLALADAYDVARIEAADETELNISSFPEVCPYSWDDVLDRPYDWVSR